MSSHAGDPDNTGSGTETDVTVVEGQPKVAEPPRYAVILHNDDYTTMECVVEVLKKFFHHTEEKAHQIMLTVHHQGQGVAGIYSYEIAETKADQAMEYAKSKGFPLKCTVESALGPHSK